jgi:hypothetical protein
MSVASLFVFFFSHTYYIPSLLFASNYPSIHPPDYSPSMVGSYLKPNMHLMNQQMILNKIKPLQEQVLPSFRSSADVIITEEV